MAGRWCGNCGAGLVGGSKTRRRKIEGDEGVCGYFEWVLIIT